MRRFTSGYRGSFSALLLGILAIVVTGCNQGTSNGSSKDSAEMTAGTIKGMVVYRERMLLPPDAQIEIQLQDVSRADAMATVMAVVNMAADGAPPYPFVIEYDTSQVDARMRYALRATIHSGDRLMFTNTDYIDPFSESPVEVLVRRVPAEPEPSAATLEDTQWQLETLSGSPAQLGAGDKPIDLVFMSKEQRAAGFSGCNRYFGSYALEGESVAGKALTLGPLAGTMMACMEGGDLERDYLNAMGEITAYRIEGNTLLLLKAEKVVASFSAQ
ncbi:MAG: META domain-containing protein [Halioglobus sp.]